MLLALSRALTLVLLALVLSGCTQWRYELGTKLSPEMLPDTGQALSLTEVGRAFAEDQVEKVKAWRKVGDLVTPSQPHADYWESSDAKFIALVVSPFVLVQPVAGEQDGKKAEKSDDLAKRNKTIVLWYSIGVIIILAAIPWPFRFGNGWF